MWHLLEEGCNKFEASSTSNCIDIKYQLVLSFVLIKLLRVYFSCNPILKQVTIFNFNP
jgi:hypothetical protein